MNYTLTALFSFCCFFLAKGAFAETGTNKTSTETPTAVATLPELCKDWMSKLPKSADKAAVDSMAAICAKVQVLDGCTSVDGIPLFHYDKASVKPSSAKKVLVFSLIHGDETHAGTVAKLWMENLEKIDPRNNWRVVPILNPDGFLLKTRTNAHQVDINRNFPTKDWEELATSVWKTTTKSNPRRFPGAKSASEPETLCALKHIQDFKPDFVVSIHTPLKVLDFDGPHVKFPEYDYLPWKSLGHFPGSLGRYMWFERQTPVLTMELKEALPKQMNTFLKLQDVIGTLVDFEKNKIPKGKEGKSVSFAPSTISSQ
jgi:hypothetical protein